MVKINLLVEELKLAGLPVSGGNSTGDSFEIFYTRELTVSELATGSAIIANHNPNNLSFEEREDLAALQAKIDFRNLPTYATLSPDETQQLVINNVLNGKTLAEIETDIDNLSNTVAGMKTGLKVVAGAIIDLRMVLSLVAKMVAWLRIIIVRTR